ncbi:MAG: NADH-quinone oxidoreductase subunit C [Candidatus Nezhaarchaeota archaeon]|nr:NADH-quinone oxidoreductase subunit C [Candidatus Nezhaarchaeota archaeon]
MVEVHDMIIDELRRRLKGGLLNWDVNVKSMCLTIRVDRSSTLEAIRSLAEISEGRLHLTTISGADLGGDSIELTYFLWLHDQEERILLKVNLPKDALRAQSVTTVLPAAILYEREVYEMLGVVFEGHPKLERLFLPENWPEGVYPLRRS